MYVERDYNILIDLEIKSNVTPKMYVFYKYGMYEIVSMDGCLLFKMKSSRLQNRGKTKCILSQPKKYS